MKVRAFFNGYVEFESDAADIDEAWTKADGALQGAAMLTINNPVRIHYADITDVSPVCRGCGCTNEEGCFEGCWWVEPDLCSSCRPVPPVTEVVP